MRIQSIKHASAALLSQQAFEAARKRDCSALARGVLLSLVLAPCALAQPYWVDRVAGNPNVWVDGIPAKDAPLADPRGLAFDSSGNLYISDVGTHRILKVDTTGAITTVAGTGQPGFSGDGGPATNASLKSPWGIAVDAEGNLYVADTFNARIRKIDHAGIITTVAGTGEPGFSGDGGPALDARLSAPTSLAIDIDGNLFFSESYRDRIRKIDRMGIVTTVAGAGERGFSGDGGAAVDASLAFPSGIALDSDGNLFIADRSNNRIRRVDVAGVITTVAGTGEYASSGDGGPATDASLANPLGIAVDRAGNLYIASDGSWKIRKITTTGTITTVLGSYDLGGDCGQAAVAGAAPWALAAGASGQIYFSDHLLRTIRRLSGQRPVECSAPLAPLETWSVGPGEVSFAGFSSRGCLVPSGPEFGGQSYVVHSSEWQRRAPGDSVWTAVGGTLRAGRICAHSPNKSGEYRAVAEMSVGGGERARYRSVNTIGGASGTANDEPTFGAASIGDQTYVSGTAIPPLALPAASGGDSPLSYSLQPTVPGLSFDTRARRLTGTPTSAGTYSMRFSVRDSDGDTATLPFTITVRSSGAGGASGGAGRYGVDDVITTLPTGFWTPDVTSGGSFQYSAGTATVRLNDGGYIDEGDYRYTCETAGGCEISNRKVLSGTIAETAAGGSDTSPPPPSGGDYSPLDDWTVSDGRVQFLFFSAGRCISLNSGTINGTTYVVHNSKWQRRADSTATWTDVAGTERSAELCSYSPTEPGQYRGVAEISIGGTRGSYSTKNVLTVESGSGSPGSSDGSSQTPSELSTVTGLKIVASDEDAVLTWNAVPGAGYYKVYHCQTVGDDIGPCRLANWYDEIAERVTGTTYRDSGRLEPSIIPYRHYYQVRPCDQSGCVPL